MTIPPGTWWELRPPGRRIVLAVLKIVASIAVVVTLYYRLPLDRYSSEIAVTLLVAGLVVFAGLVAVQVRLVIASPFPGLRAIEALAIGIPVFLALFASTYFVMATLSPGSFGTPLTRTDALYFSVTAFSTVGFGDITAKTEASRLAVTGQMIADLVVLGLAIKIPAGAATRGRQRRRDQQDARGARPAE